MVPEIADYEVRRELLRAGKSAGVRRLDQLKRVIGYLPLTTPVMLKAAEIWAEARRTGKPTADASALDGDVILAAQATSVAEAGHDVVIATTNVGHLSRFADAREWRLIG
jgi:predicted nucleic acid-binding protein